MNERIRELVEQAIVDVDVVYEDNPLNEELAKMYIPDCFAEKFAELIVRECINIACEYDKPKLSGPGLAIASNIESHFDIYIEEDGRFVK